MPRIFDNIEQHLLPALTQTLAVSERADMCVGYFNLRGWKGLGPSIEPWPGGQGRCVRLLVGMHSTPQEELRRVLSLDAAEQGMDNSQAARLKHRLALEFRRQLMQGAPTAQDEAGLRQLARLRSPGPRAYLRAELDGLVAHLYGLSEGEFAHVLVSFPLAPEPVKSAALDAYREVESGAIG